MDHQQKPSDMSTFGTCGQCKGGCRKHSGDSNGSENTVIPWPQSRMSEVASSTISDVQIALEDQTYAEQLRGLLEEDNKHRAYVVDRPNPAIDGVMVLDETTVRDLAVPAGMDGIRYIVLANEASDPNKLWHAGVRRLLPAKHPAELVRFAILYTELLLSQQNSSRDVPTDDSGEARAAAEI